MTIASRILALIMTLTMLAFTACSSRGAPQDSRQQPSRLETPSSEARQSEAASAAEPADPETPGPMETFAEEPAADAPLPAMTPENQAYYDQYLSAWGFYSPFDKSYTEETFAGDLRPYLFFYSSLAQEGKTQEYEEYQFSGQYPAKLVEDTVMRHFPVTAEQYRAKLKKPANIEGDAEYYDPELDAYNFPGGYGGGSNSGVVTEAKREGDLLTLTCEWYGMDNTFAYSHTVTIRLGAGEDEFMYLSNVVGQ